MGREVEWETARKKLRAAIQQYEEKRIGEEEKKVQARGVNNNSRKDGGERIVEKEEKKVEKTQSPKIGLENFERRGASILCQGKETETKKDKEYSRRKRGERGVEEIYSGTSRKRVHRGSGKTAQGGVSNPGNPQSDEGRMEGYSRSEICEQISESPKVQERRSGVPRRVVEEGRLHDERGHQRRVLPRGGERRREGLSGFQTRREVLPIHGITNGKRSKSIRISNNVEANGGIHKRRIRDKDCLVRRRLSDHGRVTGKVTGGHEEGSRTMHGARLEDKLQEIGSSTSEEEAIPRIHHRRRKRAKIKDSLSKKEICKEGSAEIVERSEHRSSQCEENSESCGIMSSLDKSICSNADIFESTDEMYTKKHKERKVGRTQSMVVQRCNSRRSELVGHPEDLGRADISAQTSRQLDGDRQLRLRMGRSLGKRESRSKLVEGMEEEAHQCEGARSGIASGEDIQREDEGKKDRNKGRQSGSFGLHKQNDRESSKTGKDCQEDSRDSRKRWGNSHSSVYSKRRKQEGRLNLQIKRLSQLGTEKRSIRGVGVEMGPTHDRQVRRCGDKEVEEIQLQSGVPGGRGARCIDTRLGEREQLCVPTDPSIEESSREAEEGERNSNCDSARVEETVVVSGVEEDGERRVVSRSGSVETGSQLEVHSEFQSIQDLWRARRKGWSERRLKTLVSGLSSGGLEAAWKKVWCFARNKGINILECQEEEVEEIVVEYIGMSAEALDRPKGMVETTKRAVKYALLGTGKRNPFKGELVEMYTKREVRESTKRGRKQKGVWPVITLLVRIVQVFGEDPYRYDETSLRTILAVVLCLVRMFRLADTFAIDAAEILFEEGNEYMILPMRGNKVDAAMEGMRAQVWAASNNPFDPVRLMGIYLKKTQGRRKVFVEKREEILRQMRGRSKKHSERAGKWKYLTPLFMCLKKPEPLSKESMDTCVRKLLSEIDLTADHLGRALTPGSLRKTGRNIAKEAGFEEAELDAIGNWKQKTIP
jgi:hypothetical protein